ncbi:MAG: DUF1501 domain-containing protein [Planctomycetota bacterium]
MSWQPDRRQILQAGVSALCGSAFAASCSRSPSAARVDPGGTLVLLELTGGCDGLSTVVPFEDDAYQRARPTTGIRGPGILRLNEQRGLHPTLVKLHRRFQAGRLAIVEGAGYPDPPYSHFRAQEVWHTGRRSGRLSGDGWIGRLRQAAWSARSQEPLVVHLGTELPWSMQCSTVPAFAFSSANNLGWVAEPDMIASLEHRSGQEPSASPMLARLRAGLADSNQVSRRIVEAVKSYRPRTEYPSRSVLGDSLRTIAAMLNAGFSTRVYSLSHGNFDVHGARMRSHHAKLCGLLDQALDAFLSDIAGTQAGARTCVLLFSEFGRRVEENESQGTDHGAAGPMFLLGEPVRGGLHGRHPSLTELDAQGNLLFTTDFRSVYATVLEGLFAADAKAVLGEEYPSLPLLTS